jgi:hypothetical protein
MIARAYPECPQECDSCGSEDTYLSLNGYDSALVCRSCHAEVHTLIACDTCLRQYACPEPGEPCSSFIPEP